MGLNHTGKHQAKHPLLKVTYVSEGELAVDGRVMPDAFL